MARKNTRPENIGWWFKACGWVCGRLAVMCCAASPSALIVLQISPNIQGPSKVRLFGDPNRWLLVSRHRTCDQEAPVGGCW